MPLTWTRLVSMNVMFEKKTVFPPFEQSQKIVVVLPLKSAEENLRELEGSLIRILTEKMDRLQDKFTLPARVGEL